MTSIENYLNWAWDAHDEDKDRIAFINLHAAVKELAQVVEGMTMDRKQPQETPEALAGTNPPCAWENLARRRQDLITEALIYVRINPERCERALREALK